MASSITSKDKATLQKAKLFYGRSWRNDVAHAWFTGDYQGLDRVTASALQQIRNSEREWNILTVRM